jgi:hypothetical protein
MDAILGYYTSSLFFSDPFYIIRHTNNTAVTDHFDTYQITGHCKGSYTQFFPGICLPELKKNEKSIRIHSVMAET